MKVVPYGTLKSYQVNFKLNYMRYMHSSNSTLIESRIIPGGQQSTLSQL